MKYYAEWWQGANSQFFFHVKSGNHQIVLQSEGYKELRSVERLVKNLNKGLGAVSPLELRPRDGRPRTRKVSARKV